MIEILYKDVPFANGRYFFDEDAVLKDRKNGEVVKTDENRDYVDIVFESGTRSIAEALLKVICFQNIKLPPKFWDKIVPIYVDGDSHNTNPINLCYRFEEPIKVVDLWNQKSDFYYVPYYTGYAIDRTGRLINLSSGNETKWSVSKPVEGDVKNRKLGYRVGRVLGDVKGTHCGRHRLLCLAFKHYDVDPRPLVSNHIDGVPGNDDLSNLEFITRAENNQHAIDAGLTPNSVIPVLVKNLNTGEQWSFASVAEASEKLNIPHPTLSGRLHKRNHIRFDDGIVIKKNDGSPWPELTVVKTVSKVRRVVGRNVFTGEMVVAVDAAKLGQILNFHGATVRMHAKDRLIAPVRGYNFRFFDELEDYPFHLHPAKSLQIFKKYPHEAPTGVTVYDRDKEVAFFESIELAAQHYGKSISTLGKWCHGSWNPHNLVFKMYKIEEHLGPPVR